MGARRLLTRVAIAIVVLVAAHIAWTYIEKGPSEQRIADLRAAGQPIYTTDLATAPVPDEQNAAVLLEQASAWLEEHREESAEAHLWYGFDCGGAEDWDEEEWGQAAAYVGRLAPYYAMLEEVPKRPRWWLNVPWGEDPIAAVSVIPQFREAVDHTLYRVAFDRVETGRTERAARAAVLLLHLADRCELPFMIGHLVRQVVRGSDEILRLVQKRPDFDARLFRAIVDPRLARTLQPVGPPAVPFVEERTFMLRGVRALLAGDDVAFWEDRIQSNPLWRPMLYRDACRALDLYGRAIAQCGVTPEDATTIVDRWRGEYEEISVVYPLTKMRAALAVKMFKEYTASTAKRRLTRVVMALLEYRQIHGEWPPDLTPLGDTPLDPYSGKPFLYERRGKGARIRPDHEFGFTEGDIWPQLLEDELAWSWEE